MYKSEARAMSVRLPRGSPFVHATFVLRLRDGLVLRNSPGLAH